MSHMLQSHSKRTYEFSESEPNGPWCICFRLNLLPYSNNLVTSCLLSWYRKHVNSPKQFTMKFMVARKESNDPDHANKARKLALTRNFPLFDNLNLIIIEITDHPSHLNELLKSFFLLKVVDHEVYTQSRIPRYSNFVKKVGNINSSQCTNERWN